MMDVQYAKRLYGMVWAVCNELGEKWPTPNRQDSMAYAVTEVGEAIDADLRGRRLGDKRNNHKQMSREHELAQGAMMVFKALGPKWEPTWMPEVSAYNLDDIAVYMANANNLAHNGFESWEYTALSALVAIDTYCVGVERYLEEVLQQAREKWG